MRFPYAVALFATVLISANANATESRCNTTGQLALSGHVGVLAGIGKGDRTALVKATGEARHLIGYYRDLGCDMKPLHAAIECVNTAVGQKDAQKKPIAEVAGQCLKDAGFGN